MPTFESMGNTCRDIFQDEIEDVYSIQTQYDNAPFDLDESSLGTYGVWARVTMVWGERDPSEVSGPTTSTKTYRQHGQFHVQLRAEMEAGTKNINIIAEKVKDAFRATTVNSVKFLVPNPVVHGQVKEEKVWYRIDVQCPFYADTVE
jgi:tartrate dehydratase beta subunit/fumarate hydratase class I family protein